MKVLIIRPEPGAGISAARAKAAGFEPVTLPFFAVAPRLWEVPNPADFDAMLLTSANAVRHGGDGLAKLSSLPVHAVGQHTAEAATAAGLMLASVGFTGVEEALNNAAQHGHLRLLWLCGKDRRDGEWCNSLVTRTVYAAEPLPLPSSETSAVLNDVDLIALHSPRAAKRLAEFVDAHGIDRASMLLAAFSPAIASAAGEGWRGIAVAAEPTDNALLSAAIELGKQHGFATARKAKL